MITKNIYLLNPYTEVIKVNVIEDSIFKLDINKSIIYTRQQLFDKIIAIPFLNEFEDDLSRIMRWAVLHQNNVGNLNMAKINTANLLQFYNSYSDNICSGIACVIWNIYYHFYANPDLIVEGGYEGIGGHTWNNFVNGSIDNINKTPNYKGRYLGATFEDIKADTTIYTEPLRIGTGVHYGADAVLAYIVNSELTDYSLLSKLSTIDNTKMQVPGGCSFILPVKSVNVPIRENGGEIPAYANLILSLPANKTGIIEMPFNLLSVVGTGSVKVNGLTYSLPTDESALKTVLQGTLNYSTERWYHSFEVLTNTGGLSAEFLVNHSTVKLYRKNLIEYEMASGSITFERAKAANPVPTHPLSVDINGSGYWTLDYNTFFEKRMSFKHPLQGNASSYTCVDFLPNSQQKFSPRKLFVKYAEYNTAQYIKGDTPSFDLCFSSKLTPSSNTFSDSLELSFVIFDASNCYYTLDGTTPDATKTLYTAPFTISATTTVKWINIKTDYTNSHVNSRTITKL
jgi:hypothetical protein